MLLFLWNYLRGYVMIEVSGTTIERFINISAHKGIYLWDLYRYENKKGESCVRMKVSIQGFKNLHTISKKSGCKLRIVSKNGSPFVLYRYRKRKLFLGGFLFFIGILYFLTSFLWLVRIEGTKRINREELQRFCAQEGLKPGVYKSKIDAKDLETKLMKQFPDISWVNVHIKGTTANISLTEIIPRAPIKDTKTPSNIVAKKDGLIYSMVTIAGTPLVKEKDVVRKGDLLVSGELLVKSDETGIITERVRAQAEIYALLYEELSFKIPFDYVEKEYSEETKKRYYISILGKEFFRFNWKMPFKHFEIKTSRTQLKLGEDYPLPIILFTQTYKPFTPQPKKLDLYQAMELAERMVTGRIVREFDINTDVLDKKITTSVSDTHLYVNASITTIERIDEESVLE